MPNFEQDSVASCVSYSPLEVTSADFPWINAHEAVIPTFLVDLKDGTRFRFGSLIGLNNTVTDIADTVPEDPFTRYNGMAQL